MLAISPTVGTVTQNRITWQTVDQTMTRWSAISAVAAVLVAVLGAFRFVQGAVVEGIAACVLVVVVLLAWWLTSRLHRAKVVIDAAGIRREGRGGFSYSWDRIRMVGVGEGLMAADAPYLVIATTGRRAHSSGLAAAGSGFKKPSASVPVDAGLVDKVRPLLVAKGVWRTTEQWASEI